MKTLRLRRHNICRCGGWYQNHYSLHNNVISCTISNNINNVNNNSVQDILDQQSTKVRLFNDISCQSSSSSSSSSLWLKQPGNKTVVRPCSSSRNFTMKSPNSTNFFSSSSSSSLHLPPPPLTLNRPLERKQQQEQQQQLNQEQIQKDDCNDGDDGRNKFVIQVEETIRNVLNDVSLHHQVPATTSTDTSIEIDNNKNGKNSINKHKKYTDTGTINVKLLPTSLREQYIIARSLQHRISTAKQSNQCQYCWMQNGYCFCNQIRPIQLNTNNNNSNNNYINRIFVLMHHKEFLLSVDTAKLILSSFPQQCQLVIGGISEQYQSSLQEMISVLDNNNKNKNNSNNNNTMQQQQQSSSKSNNNDTTTVTTTSTPLTLVLFPSDNSLTYKQILQTTTRTTTITNNNDEILSSSVTNENQNRPYLINIIIIDGTWEQAQKLYNRYIVPYSDATNITTRTTTTNNTLVRHVRLSEQSLQSLSIITKQTELDGYCFNSTTTKSKIENLMSSLTTTCAPQQQQRQRLQLQTSYVDNDGYGKQQRYHPNPLREISTIHALQLLLQDIDPTNTTVIKSLVLYQKIAHTARLAQHPQQQHHQQQMKHNANNTRKWIPP